MSKIDPLQGTLDMLILRVQVEAQQQNWDRLSASVAEVKQQA